MDCKQCLTELKKNQWQEPPKKVKEHLEHCPTCSSEFQWMLQNRAAFAEMDQIPIPPNLHQNIMQALEPELISVQEPRRRNWFEFLQWKPVFSFAVASILLVTLATLRLNQPNPEQTLELIKPDEPPMAMRSLTKEGEAAIKDSLNTMTAPVAGVTGDRIAELYFEISAEEFKLWEEFFIKKGLTYQRNDQEKEEQLILEGTGIEIVEWRKSLNEALDSSQRILIHDFLLQTDPKAEKIKEEEATVLQEEQSYRITFQKKQKQNK